MSETTHIKRYNHRIHPCLPKKKEELLKHLVELHQGKSILLISSANSLTSEVQEKNMTITSDAALKELGDRQWDILISYDLPDSLDIYNVRLSHAKDMAVIISDGKQQQELYNIETGMGKNLSREIIKGFEIEAPKSEYVSTDEDGKHKFSGKTKDRNHRFDGTPRTEAEKRHKAPKKPRKSVTIKEERPKQENSEMFEAIKKASEKTEALKKETAKKE